MFKPYEGAEPYIFVSYARKDQDRVLPILEALNEAGYRVWYDAGIPWGDDWMGTIADHIDRAEVCLLFWSEASAVSQHCKAETAEMVAVKKTIVTAFLDDTPVDRGLRMYLRRFQSVKLSDFPSDAAFVESLRREAIFATCRHDTIGRQPTTKWNKDRTIQWYLDGSGVLTITAVPHDNTVSMPDYKRDIDGGCSTAPWMPEREKIRSVVIQSDIDGIGEYAFAYCRSLTSVTIPDSVIKIGGLAFYGCSSLTSVTIPDNVTAIGNYVFDSCSSMTSVTIPDSVKSIGTGAFEGCSSLTNVTIPNSVTAIGNWAFSYCTSLKCMTIPDSLTAIGWATFKGCSGLMSVTIPDSVTKIGSDAFEGCSSLTSVSAADAVAIGDNVTEIHAGAFKDCPKVTNIMIGINVVIIGERAFEDCGVTNIMIGINVRKICNRAFHNCKNLTALRIPDSVTEIGAGAFGGCTNLKSVIIPNSVTTIGEEAFIDCVSLEELIISNGKTNIGKAAFWGCVKLWRVKAPKQLQITRYAFEERAVRNLPIHFEYFYHWSARRRRLSIAVVLLPMICAFVCFWPKGQPDGDTMVEIVVMYIACVLICFEKKYSRMMVVQKWMRGRMTTAQE